MELLEQLGDILKPEQKSFLDNRAVNNSEIARRIDMKRKTFESKKKHIQRNEFTEADQIALDKARLELIEELKNAKCC